MNDKIVDIVELKRKNSTWRSERFLSALTDLNTEELLREGYEYSKKYKVLELYIAPGRIISKVQSEVSNPVRIEITIPLIEQGVWENTFKKLSSTGALLAYLLTKQFPEELNELFSRNGLDLFPSNLTELTLQQDGKEIRFTEKAVCATLCRLVDKLDVDPFAIFILRGLSPEDGLLTARKLRAAERPQLVEGAATTNENETSALDTNEPCGEIEKFWLLSEKLKTISYSLKADELPASIIKRLDPLPLGGLEEDIDYLLQEAYAHIAKRAQAFALGL